MPLPSRNFDGQWRRVSKKKIVPYLTRSHHDPLSIVKQYICAACRYPDVLINAWNNLRKVRNVSLGRNYFGGGFLRSRQIFLVVDHEIDLMGPPKIDMHYLCGWSIGSNLSNEEYSSLFIFRGQAPSLDSSPPQSAWTAANRAFLNSRLFGHLQNPF